MFNSLKAMQKMLFKTKSAGKNSAAMWEEITSEDKKSITTMRSA